MTTLILALVSLNSLFRPAYAESTSITGVTYPERVLFDLDSRTTDPPLLVTATVSYSDARPGFFFSVSIFDLDSGNIVKGSGKDSSRRCDLDRAVCSGEITSPSGVEHVAFLIKGFKQTMSLAIIANLYDGSGSLIYNSESDYEFVIRMTSAFVLRVSAPITVPVSVDGVPQPKGNVSLYLVPGVHEISVPDAVQLNNVTRMKFERWSDGVNQTIRSINLSSLTLLTAIYATQYLLAATSAQGNVTGNGWYDVGSNATFSVPIATKPMSGLMGLLGGKWTFKGWYENGEIMTASTSGSMLVLGSHSLVARWAGDYELPSLAFITAASALIIVLVHGNRERRTKNHMTQEFKLTKSKSGKKPRSVHGRRRPRIASDA